MQLTPRSSVTAFAVAGLLSAGCAGDVTPATSGDETGDTSGDTNVNMDDPTTSLTAGTAMPDSSGDATATDDTGPGESGTDTDTGDTGDTGTTDDTGTTGGMAEPGQTAFDIVSSGTRAASSNYTIVYTFGQSTPNQSQLNSSNYMLQGGLVGANGRPPQ